MPDETNLPPSPPAANAAPEDPDDSSTNSARFLELRNALDQQNLEYETRLISVRKGLSDSLTNPPPATSPASAEPPPGSGPIQDLLNLFLAPVETFKRVMAGQSGATPPPVLVPAGSPPTAPAPTAPATNSPGNLNGTNGFAPPALPPQSYQVSPAPFSSPGVASAESGGLLAPDPAASFVSSADGQSTALQSAAGQMQIALEQNSQMSISIFNQLAEVVAGQNRALDEVNRKIALLGGQINSLKNP